MPVAPPIRAVLFDVEDVIAHPDVAAADRRLAARWPGLTHADVQRARNGPALYPLWESHSTGRLDLEGYWGAVLAALDRPAAPADVAAIVDTYRATAWAWLDAVVLAWVPRLRAAGLRAGILSNSAPYHDDHAAVFEGLFDVAHFSHRTGRRKPDADAYTAAAVALDAAPAEVVFVDDKPRNTDAAAALGFVAIRFTGAVDLAARLGAPGMATGR
ncbi:hypothetical protein DCC79_15545 [bacterium]|nr:MAG: hypothetical protein DCC79_15545 [bacterium]